MDAARAAEMSWPDSNSQFRRRWSTPPGARERRPMAPPIGPAKPNSESNSSGPKNNHETRLTQQAILLDRAADCELAHGRHRAAERLAGRAVELREAAQ